MNNSAKLKLLFIVNPGSGNSKTNWPQEIERHFKPLQHSIELFALPNPCEPLILKQKIDDYQPQIAVAVGGDGTVKLVAECLLQTNIALGILPAGSANGMAKELDIPADAQKAIDVLLNGRIEKISVVRINKELCIHLSDLGFNAFVIKKFDSDKGRGMWGYLKASWKVLWQQPQMSLIIQADRENVQRQATMIVIANATRYGSGAVINPEGRLNDASFEVIIVKKFRLPKYLK
jgi:diacylglycerol kinase family enzyme